MEYLNRGLGVARTVRTKHIIDEDALDIYVNEWLENNPGLEIIDIRFSTSATHDVWATEALIIYRKEG